MLEFDFEDDGHGGTIASTAVAGDVTSIVTDMSNDWAVIRPVSPLADRFPIVKLSEAVDPIKGEGAYIVQHPGGRRKRLGFVRNQVSDFDERVLTYLTDTEPGSSGSPVFNAADHQERGDSYSKSHRGPAAMWHQHAIACSETGRTRRRRLAEQRETELARSLVQAHSPHRRMTETNTE